MKKTFLQTIKQLGLSSLQRRGRRVFMLSTMTVLFTSILAFASIPGPDGVIHGCYNNKGDASLRIIDSNAQCKSNETALNFNQTGPQGPQGIQGVQGPQDHKDRREQPDHKDRREQLAQLVRPDLLGHLEQVMHTPLEKILILMILTEVPSYQ